jgi:hypothetical protein
MKIWSRTLRQRQSVTLYPSKYIRSDGAVNPDGLLIYIDWLNLRVGSSVFVPALNMHKLIKQMNRYAERYDMKLLSVERIEAGKLGVRFWRMV